VAAYSFQLDIHVQLLSDNGGANASLVENIISALAPLLQPLSAIAKLAPTLSCVCARQPHAQVVADVCADVAHETLKKNMVRNSFF
jgi:hypothetical protein